MRENLPVTGRGVELPADANILSTTTPHSRITYVNPDFVRISGFSEEELLGQPHNIVRHPDMPPAVFGQMWTTLKGGRSWMGLIKNRCKHGDHYWVSAYVTPILRDGETVEFQSVRTRPDPAHVAVAEKHYARMRAGGAAAGRRSLRLELKLLLLVWGGLFAGTAATAFSTGVPVGHLAPASLVGGAVVSGGIVALLAPLRRLVRKAGAIASNPLGQRLYTGRGDEFGQIEFALRMLQAEVGSVIGRIGDASDRLGEHAGRLLRDIESSSAVAAEQQQEADGIAAAVSQMVSSIQAVAGNAQHAAEAAGRADEAAAIGGRMVADTRESITALEAEIRLATEVIRQLEGQSNEISRVLEVIREVAEQTSLLALNAAIEAARAGEQGRGFAVVADEVRNLAARTERSASETQGMIVALQERARSAVVAMESSGAQTRGSVEHAQAAAAALEDIGLRVREITEMNSQIAAAVEQQSVVSASISRSIDDIRAAAGVHARNGQDNFRNASSVAQLARALSELARQFWERRRS